MVQDVAWLVFIGWVISYANEWEDYSNYFGKGGDFQDLGHRPLLGLSTVPWNCHGTSGVPFHLLIEDQGLVLSAILAPLDSNWFILCPWATRMCHSFKSCALPLSLLLKKSLSVCNPIDYTVHGIL